MKSLKALINKKNLKYSSTISLKVGDDLKEYDIVVMGYYNEKTKDYEYYNIGIYRNIRSFKSIEFEGAYFDQWESAKKTYSFQYYGNKYIHQVIKIYRPIGKIIENPADIKSCKELEMNSDYITIYENTDLAKKFNIYKISKY